MYGTVSQQARFLLGGAAAIALAVATPSFGQTAATPVVTPAAASTAPGTLTIQADKPGAVINRDIFGQFAEHLGLGIYDGVWVGKGSKIPNVRGIRSDVVDALKAIKVPVVRWPGGCFADEYHWRDGIGPAAKRRTTVNANWANAVEPNSFGTDEFMDFAQQIGSEAYISVNVGSGTVQEASDWLDYMTGVAPSSAAGERAANGHKAPYKVKYLGLGNEMWGCGGPYTGEEYVTKMKIFAHFVHNQNPDQAPPKVDFAAIAKDLMTGKAMDSLPANPNGMKRIAGGPNSADPSYTEIIMKAWKARSPIYWDIDGISLHQYTWGSLPFNEPATGFDEKSYATVLMQTQWMDRTITKHSEIMDKYDPKKHVALVVDEWGVWLKPRAGTESLFLIQDSSLRDGIAAAMNLNIFSRHADRVRMTNIAQMVNVLQAMIMTEGPKMVLTPTYHVYRMYVPFQDATYLPVTFNAGEYKVGAITLPKVDALAARGKDGKVWLSLVNLDANNPADVTASIPGVAASRAEGEVLTAASFNTVNTFQAPAAVAPKPFRAVAQGGSLTLRLPPHSVTVVHLEP
ncbi:alpha-N-arabinofuranosidase [Sphingomonas solaris]|uniref:non-reducing end alpha-L-arabinofuranosidase n=1 Tax=Alterirhizorhabdus solaris TaxID=2529389 RepID=A0A558R457_9SPHN|nr:alpha-L-arabinofuranosidase C-terminal domain-containing protein [Sphingomonas solaris]TVV74160.1 alpha-N-arabinofuranosidase [Sphingomonas solaris]